MGQALSLGAAVTSGGLVPASEQGKGRQVRITTVPSKCPEPGPQKRVNHGSLPWDRAV